MPRTSLLQSQPSGSRHTDSTRNGSLQEQRHISASQPNAGGNDADQDKLVINMVKVLLNLSVNKQLIKKSDLTKIALDGNFRMFPKIIGQVVSELKDVYGYKLIETERNKTFILVSNIPCGSLLDLNEDYRRKYTLLYMILGYIFMKNGNVPEQGVWDFLGKLNIFENEEHQYFGNVRRLVNETFTKQAYLVRTKQVVEGMNDDRYFLSWGVRANHELNKRDILESICKLMGKPSVCFISQHTAAYGLHDGDDEDNDSMEASQV
ncbi:non-structural maintenance of chromosomes element 3 homolog [Uranotaenia lowii]|uniref:non-structural maintenance of chromosomes element 3 homolog n=1 Tax=Uranotaenia lowii TaxID=190385 RepID=UPI0024783FE9|nr:non-structural maintenance of chromosomes element 3 homolog [Uranotaenia lowii]